MELVHGIESEVVHKIGIKILYIYLIIFCFNSVSNLVKMRANAVLIKFSTNYLKANMQLLRVEKMYCRNSPRQV